MAVEGLGSDKSGLAFLVSAGVVYEIMAAAVSSPQTTELNAHIRSKTLMKWVYVGIAQSVIFVGLASIYERQAGRPVKPILAGATLAGALQLGCYEYAKRSGLKSNAPGTEQY